MVFKETRLKNAFIIELEKIVDDRGFFSRVWCQKEFEANGLNVNVVQCNLAFNTSKGTLRGMHYQIVPHQEAKLVRCTRGKVYDVIIDLRSKSPTYLQWIGVELSSENRKMLYVPENFAHGYLTLTDNTELFYQVSNFYSPESESGIRWNDRKVNIKWPQTNGLTMTDKDKNWPDFHA